jgi:hypothetical protein
MDSLEHIIAGKDFWVGASSSIVGALILGIIAYAFRKSLALTKAQRDRTRQEDELFKNALRASSPLTPFAYGVVQARALRHFLLAVFVAYVGDVLDVFWPFNSIMYLISLIFMSQGLRWFYEIERNAISVFQRFRFDSQSEQGDPR